MNQLRAVFLLGTLKKRQTLSNTQALCEVVAEVLLRQEGVRSEIVRLRDYDIQPGTKTEIDNDDWPKIVNKMRRADIVIFATPVFRERSNVWMSSMTSSSKPANRIGTTRSAGLSSQARRMARNTSSATLNHKEGAIGYRG